MRLDIVTPENQLVSSEVISVQIPGMDGDMTVMENHAPLVTTLRPGVVTVTGDDGVAEYLVTGGFFEVSDAGASVLAEMAMPKAEATREMIEALLVEANEALEQAVPEARTAAALRINDVNELLARYN